jgi:hypothetical protein
MSETRTSCSTPLPTELSSSDPVQKATAPGMELPDAPSAKHEGAAISTQVSRALNEWVAGMGGPQDPPFYFGSKFPDSEWNRFFRVFAVSTALAGTVAVARDFAPKLLEPVIPDGRSLGVLTVFACFGVVYRLYSKLFGISITIRQSLFCFMLITTPWFPLYVLLKTNGANLGIVWFLLMPGLGVYVFFLLARAIHIVSGASMVRVALSLLLAVVLAFAAFATHVPAQAPASDPCPQTPAAAH